MDNKKEIIFSAAKEIAFEEGITNINIRAVAKKSGVSIGTVYNYYATKSDLIVAVIGNFWEEAFKNIDISNLGDKDFYEKLQEMYDYLKLYINKFKENWIEQLSQLEPEEKEYGREVEAKYFTKIYTMIISLMDQDENINNKAWEKEFSQRKIVIFIFDNMLLILKSDDGDFGFFIKILKKVMS